MRLKGARKAPKRSKPLSSPDLAASSRERRSHPAVVWERHRKGRRSETASLGRSETRLSEAEARRSFERAGSSAVFNRVGAWCMPKYTPPATSHAAALHRTGLRSFEVERPFASAPRRSTEESRQRTSFRSPPLRTACWMVRRAAFVSSTFLCAAARQDHTATVLQSGPRRTSLTSTLSRPAFGAGCCFSPRRSAFAITRAKAAATFGR